MKMNKAWCWVAGIAIIFTIGSLVCYIRAATKEQLADWERLIPSAIIGTTLFIGGAYTYFSIWCRHKDCLKPMKWSQRIIHLIARVPDDTSTPWRHVFAGVLACTGLCLILGNFTTFLTSPKYDVHGTALTAAGLFFGILLAIISFWTLWQTKRIEQLQGANIEGFRTLTRSITNEIEELIVDFERHGRQASSHHRIFLVTTNPDFGGLSFPFTPDQENFYMSLLKAADMAASPSNNGGQLQLSVLCGDESAVVSFNKNWLEKNGGSDRIPTANARVERLIQELNGHAGKPVVIRKPSIPEMQFAIIGHTVFEFILFIGDNGGRTRIAGARKIEDGLVCQRFLSHYEALKKMS